MNTTSASELERIELPMSLGQADHRRGASRLTAFRGLGPWYALWTVIFVWTIVFGFVASVALVDHSIRLMWVLSATGVILIPMTFLSYLPLVFFISFMATERLRGRRNSIDAIENVGWSYLEKDVVAWHRKAFSLERYPIPITIALLTFFGWWAFVFFHAGPVVIEDFARDHQMARLMEAVASGPPVSFGFLGAYFFSVSFLFFRYMKADLGPAIFVHICVRTWTVTILVLVLTVIWEGVFDSKPSSISNSVLIAISFLGGITPPVLMDLIRSFVREKLTSKLNDDSAELGLELIDGLSSFKIARLTEEGIENLQNLAMEDPARLVVVTQEGGLTVLDWIDQAMLRIYIPDSDAYAKYVGRGVRTAYDLFIAGRIAGHVRFVRGFWVVVKDPADPENVSAGILASILNHPNFQRIKAMREESLRILRDQTLAVAG